jgi:hypothetical protein
MMRPDVFQHAVGRLFFSGQRIFLLPKWGSIKEMKISHIFQIFAAFGCVAVTLFISGCATTDSKTTGENFPSRYTSADGRTIDIGPRTAANGGLVFKEPHMERCWLATNFNFNGYGVLYIAPTLSTAKFHDDEVAPHDIAKQNIPLELQRELESRGVFPKVVTSDSSIPTGARVLKLENTIVEYKKGGGGARYWVGMYGGGQPVVRVLGKMTDGDKTVFEFDMRRSGVSGSARVFGGYMKDTDIQLQDIRSLALDLGDFVSAIAGKFPEKTDRH